MPSAPSFRSTYVLSSLGCPMQLHKVLMHMRTCVYCSAEQTLLEDCTQIQMRSSLAQMHGAQHRPCMHHDLLGLLLVAVREGAGKAVHLPIWRKDLLVVDAFEQALCKHALAQVCPHLAVADQPLRLQERHGLLPSERVLECLQVDDPAAGYQRWQQQQVVMVVVMLIWVAEVLCRRESQPRTGCTSKSWSGGTVAAELRPAGLGL